MASYCKDQLVHARRPGCEFDPDASHLAYVRDVFPDDRYKVEFAPESLFPGQEIFVTACDISSVLVDTRSVFA